MELLPVIDLLNFPAEKGKFLTACEQLGCFRVVNHGVPVSLQAEMKATVNSLFDLPEDIKCLNKNDFFGGGYRGQTPLNPLFETFGVYDAASPADVDVFCTQLNASLQHREVIRGYASKLHGLVVDIANKIAESMGLEVAESCAFEEWTCMLRPNKYSFKEETVGNSGVFAHTDTSFLTVLQEDEYVGGLEMMDRSSGEFVPVDPVPGSLLVNLGDIAKAWSNGRLHNVKHRVTCKEASPRTTIAFFLWPPKGGQVEAPAALVNSDHPRLYKTFAYEDYRKLLVSTKSFTGETLSLLERTSSAKEF